MNWFDLTNRRRQFEVVADDLQQLLIAATLDEDVFNALQTVLGHGRLLLEQYPAECYWYDSLAEYQNQYGELPDLERFLLKLKSEESFGESEESQFDAEAFKAYLAAAEDEQVDARDDTEVEHLESDQEQEREAECEEIEYKEENWDERSEYGPDLYSSMAPDTDDWRVLGRMFCVYEYQHERLDDLRRNKLRQASKPTLATLKMQADRERSYSRQTFQEKHEDLQRASDSIEMLAPVMSNEMSILATMGIRGATRQDSGSAILNLYTGGINTGEVIGYAAPHASGKTTMVCTMATEVATKERQRADDEGRHPKTVYVLSYEDGETPRVLALANIANIERKVVDDVLATGDLNLLHGPRSYTPQERRLLGFRISAAKSGKTSWPPSQRERFDQAVREIDTNLCFSDFSAARQQNRDYANGYVNGIRKFVLAHQRLISSPGVAGIFVDYAGLVVRNYLANSQRQEHEQSERKLITRLPAECKSLAIDLRCFILISHQLAAVEGERPPGSAPRLHAYAESKAFAENLDAAFISGRPTADGYAIFRHDKARHTKTQSDRVMKIDGQYGRWVMSEDNMRIVGNKIIDADMAERFLNPSGGIQCDTY